ncbi:MAG: 6,7-dimethyl-8-ribityllumazine synthase, partial [Cutibacterium granulosum]
MSTRTSFSGPAAPDLTGLRGDGLKVAIVAAQWHQEIMDALVDGATRGLAESGIDE